MTSSGDALQPVGPEASVLSHTHASAANPTSYGFCSWHNRFADDVRLIDAVEQGTGVGGVQYACPPCITTHHLTPFADQP